MADDIGRDSQFLIKEIQRLEKEKEELEVERRNKERQLLEQRLKELKGAVTSLKSSDGGSTLQSQQRSSGGRSSGTSPLKTRHGTEAVENDDGEENLEAKLQESRAQIQFLQSQLQGSPSSKGQKSKVKDVERSSDSSSNDDEGEDVMSNRHKQAIQANRDILVENMIPDDIFNDLISRKILSTADVSRIKERNTREAVNEELLNNLCRRSDRAFHVFVLSLRKTLQEYLANRIDPQSRSRKKKRKRQTGEVNISVDCEDVEPLSSTRRGQRVANVQRPGVSSHAQCACQEVEEQILLMAKEAFRNIRRRDATPASFEQFRKELQQTNAIIKDSMEIMHTLKILCRHGDITGVSEGSVVFSVRCHTVLAARELWDMYTSGSLLSLVQRSFVTKTLKKKCHARRITLKVRIAEEEYHSCLRELERREKLSASANKPTVLVTSASVPRHRKRKCHEENDRQSCSGKSQSLQGISNPRRAFQEIAKNLTLSPAVLIPSKQAQKSSSQVPVDDPSLTSPTELKGRSPLYYNLRLRPL